MMYKVVYDKIKYDKRYDNWQCVCNKTTRKYDEQYDKS